MEEKMGIDIREHPRIKALLKLSSFSFQDDELRFMDIKDFVAAKKPSNGFYLKEIVENNYVKSSLTKRNDESQSFVKSKTPNQKPTNETWQERMIRIVKANPQNSDTLHSK
jgi:hypothetical protein